MYDFLFSVCGVPQVCQNTLGGHMSPTENGCFRSPFHYFCWILPSFPQLPCFFNRHGIQEEIADKGSMIAAITQR